MHDDNHFHDIVFTTASGVIHKGKAHLHNVFISADGVQGECQVYDGINDNGRLILDIQAISDDSAGLISPSPIRIHHGIYIKVNAATTSVSIIFGVEHD